MALRNDVFVVFALIFLLFCAGCITGTGDDSQPVKTQISDMDCLETLDKVAKGISVTTRNFRGYSQQWESKGLSDPEYTNSLRRFESGYAQIIEFMKSNENITGCDLRYSDAKNLLVESSKSYEKATTGVLDYLGSGSDKASRDRVLLEDVVDELDVADGYFEKATAELQRRQKELSD
ncbi:MAG: hypothetical protein ABH950_06495 [Candidatus Altiarchaeota archaeon]